MIIYLLRLEKHKICWIFPSCCSFLCRCIQIEANFISSHCEFQNPYLIPRINTQDYLYFSKCESLSTAIFYKFNFRLSTRRACIHPHGLQSNSFFTDYPLFGKFCNPPVSAIPRMVTYIGLTSREPCHTFNVSLSVL